MIKTIRNESLLIIIFLLKAIKLNSPIILILIFNFNKYKILSLISLLSYCLLIIIYCFIKWINIKLTLNQKNINYQYGIFLKKSIKIPLSNLTVINIKQTLIQKVFNICTLKLIDGNINSKKPEVNMVLKNNIAFMVETLIKNYKNLNVFKENDNFYINQTKPIFEITMRELILFAITGNNIAFGIGVIFTAKEFLKKLEKYLNFHIMKVVDPVIELKLIYKNYGTHIIYIILMILIVFFIISTLMSVIQKFIKFYDFRVCKDEKNIVIKYGLLSKKKYSLPIENIVSINLHQNSIKQILNLYNIKICTVGYGQEKTEQAILYPIANNDKAIKILKKLLPEFDNGIDIIKSPKRAFSKFFTLPISIFLLFYLILIILNSKFKISIFLLPILILSRYLNYKNVSIAYNKNFLLGINGGFYKNILILKTFKIQSIEKRSTYFQRRKQICSYKINYFNGSINLKHLDEKIFNQLKNSI